MKRLNAILNIIMGAFVGLFIGHGVYVVWNFKTHPELYAMQSAPWLSIIIYSWLKNPLSKYGEGNG